MARLGVLVAVAALLASCSAASPDGTPTPLASPTPTATTTPAATPYDPMLWSGSIPPLPAAAPFADREAMVALLDPVLDQLGMPALHEMDGPNLLASETDRGDHVFLLACSRSSRVAWLSVTDGGAPAEVGRDMPHPWLVVPTALFDGPTRSAVAGFLTRQMQAVVARQVSSHASALFDGLVVDVTLRAGADGSEAEIQVGIPRAPGADPISVCG